MSFGFSVSDIVGCARLAYRLYDEFRNAPEACQTFAQELLLFHQVLMKIKSTIESEAGHLDHSDQAALSACLDSCKELLYVQIMGANMVPTKSDDMSLYMHESYPFHIHPHRFRLLQGWLQRFGERSFALRIPKLQRAISSQIEKLNVFLALYVFTIH